MAVEILKLVFCVFLSSYRAVTRGGGSHVTGNDVTLPHVTGSDPEVT